MKYIIAWVDDAHLLARFEENMTWDEFHIIMDEVHAYIREKSHPVDVILEYKNSGLPRGNPMLQFQSITKRQPPNTGRIIIVNPQLDTAVGKYIKMLADMMRRLTPGKDTVQLVATLDEASTVLDMNVEQLKKI